MVVGRACFDDGRTRMFAYVHRYEPSTAARLARFLQESGVDKERRVTIVADGTGSAAFEVARLARQVSHGDREARTHVRLAW